MKKWMILAVCLMGLQAQARPTMCAPGMKEVIACTADAWIPFYPFTSVCQAPSGEVLLSIHAGSTTQAGILAVTVSTAPNTTTLTVNDPEYSAMAFSFAKAAGPKTKAVLSWDGWTGRSEEAYTCVQ